MELLDGLEHYKMASGDYEWTLRLEKKAEHILALIKQYDTNPPVPAMKEVRQLLIEIEKWKAGCLQQRMGNACRNSDTQIWEAIYAATKSNDDIETLLAIMELKGFGSSRDDETGQKRAKVATSVLRFLWPEKWGVVDWRVATMLGFLKNNNWDVRRAVDEAKLRRAKDFRADFDIINEVGASEYNNQYREISKQRISSLPRAADVDMAVFGLSLLAWPMR
jgi:hypothetical protein